VVPECEEQDDDYQEDPHGARYSDSGSAEWPNLTFVEPSVKANDVRGKNDKPQSKSHEKRDCQIVARFHFGKRYRTTRGAQLSIRVSWRLDNAPSNAQCLINAVTGQVQCWYGKCPVIRLHVHFDSEQCYSYWCLSGMRICPKLAVLCFVLGISVIVGWAQTKKPPKTSVPAILNNPPDANPQYFPKGIFGDTSDKGAFKDFLTRWYSSDLRAMHEPSLFEATSKDRSLIAYRFLWLRTFHHPIAIRLTIRPDGNGALTGKVTSGAGGYEPGDITWNESIDTPKAQVQQFINAVQMAEFWTSPSDQHWGGNDGAQWIMEGVQGGTYHVVDRWSPEKTNYARMCLFLLNLSKIQVPAKDIY